ncbi:MAG: hypothetical protein IPM42_21235 [Saprospiraceae bacterium]|nr:hypothetical protein [Saprospiraceae bacterium]
MFILIGPEIMGYFRLALKDLRSRWQMSKVVYEKSPYSDAKGKRILNKKR